jgi:anti-sigma regulatory factor (Ser/Thr protein kinase)
VEAEFTHDEVRYRIRDQGHGFNPATVLDPRTTPRHLTADSGRGLSLMRLFMDEVTFNERGNEITLVKRKQGVMI